MTDYTWPSDLVPFGSSFKLQPHTGGTESPFSRVSKVYGLSAPRWTCSLSFRSARGGRWGRGAHTTAARLDTIIATLHGRLNRIALWDFDYAKPRGGLAYVGVGNLATSKGATSMTLTGLAPGSAIYTGDYLGGDGRPHMVTSATFDRVAAYADSSGHATVTFEPPLSSNVAANTVNFTRVTGLFRIVSDDLGDNYNEAGNLTAYALQFVEDL